jgi:microcystin-dependent protein
MGEPFIGEIRMFGGNFAPAGWAFCSGQAIPISENDALFVLIGTTYGGDGQETFNLPNLQSRVPIHAGTGQDGNNYQLGEAAGVESVTLTIQQIPLHTHPFTGTTANGTITNPGGNVIGGSLSSVQPYIDDAAATPLNANSVTPTGGSQPHENCQPFLCVNFIISLFGVFPQQA